MATLLLTSSCVVLGCTTERPVCHRCGQERPDVTERFEAGPVGSFSLSGRQPKLSVRPHHSCPPCWDEFTGLLAKEG
jgi:hypothetical protein